MASTPTLVGNLTSDIELRYTQSGQAVANLTIAVEDRKFDKQTNQWGDGNVWFARCTIWGEMAEQAASSLAKGNRVIAQGRIGQRDWEDKEGNKRTSVEVTLDEVGPSLKYATATVVRAQKGQGAGQAAAGGPNNWAASPSQGQANWGAPAGAQGGTPGGNWDTGNYTNDEPF